MLLFDLLISLYFRLSINRHAPSLVVEQGGDADTTMVIHDLRGQVSRARERAEILEERLDETVRRNRRLELEVAEAMEIGVRGSFSPCFCFSSFFVFFF